MGNRRLGKRERARVKNFRGSTTVVCSAGTFRYKSGLKKCRRFCLLVEAAIRAHAAGNLLNPKMLSLRDGYTTKRGAPNVSLS
jgi:hypothetical protein